MKKNINFYYEWKSLTVTDIENKQNFLQHVERHTNNKRKGHIGQQEKILLKSSLDLFRLCSSIPRHYKKI